MVENFDQAREQQEQKFQEMKGVFSQLGKLEGQPTFDKNSGLVKLKYEDRNDILFFSMETGKFMDEYGVIDKAYTLKFANLGVYNNKEEIYKNAKRGNEKGTKLVEKTKEFFRNFGGKLGKEVIPDFHEKMSN